MCVCAHVQTNIDIGEEERKDEEKGSREEERKDYNMGVLRQVQVIFGHLASSKLQYFVPRGFWKHFKSVAFCSVRCLGCYGGEGYESTAGFSVSFVFVVGCFCFCLEEGF